MSEDRKDQRVKVQTLKAKYKSATVEEFIEQYAADISRGGIFIKTPKPPPNGTLLKIEIQLKDATPVISAVGRVVWRRETPEGGQAAGMGIKFVKVDETSQSVVDRIVAIKGEDAGPRFDSTPPAAETLGNPAGENTSEFFGTTNPSEEMPAPQDRTMMRQMSAFLGEALRGAVEEPTKPGPSSATPGAKPAPAPAPTPAPAPAAPSSAGVPGVASAGRPAGAKPSIPKATMVGLSPVAPGVSPMAAFAAEAQAKAAAAEAAEAAAKASAPVEPAKPVASAGMPAKGPSKPIGKGTMVGLAPMVPPAAAAIAAPPKAPESDLASALSRPADPNQTPPRGIDQRAAFEADDGGSTAVADRSQIDQLLAAAEDVPEPAKPAPAPAPVAVAAKKPAPPPVENEFGEPDEPEPAKPVAAPAPAPAVAPTPAPALAAAPVAPSAPVPPSTALPVPAQPAAPAAPAPGKPPMILFVIIGVLVIALIGVIGMFAMKK